MLGKTRWDRAFVFELGLLLFLSNAATGEAVCNLGNVGHHAAILLLLRFYTALFAEFKKEALDVQIGILTFPQKTSRVSDSHYRENPVMLGKLSFNLSKHVVFAVDVMI